MGREPEPNIYEQSKKEVSTPQSEQREKEQAPEEIRADLETALDKGLPVDLVILTLDGEPRQTSDLLVEEIEDDYLTMTYLDEKGDIGEGIPLEISRVKKATLRKSLIEK